MPQSPELPRQGSLIDTIRDLRKPKTETDDGWVIVGSPSDEIAPPFQNGWLGETGKSPVSWFVDSLGNVQFRGILVVPSGVTYPSTVFTLPESARPEYDEPFVIGVKGGGYANILVKATSGDFVVEKVVVS